MATKGVLEKFIKIKCNALNSMPEKKEEEKKETKADIVSEVLKKIEYHLSKNSIDESELYNVSKDFFKRYFELDYEFTYKELLEELDKIYLESELKENTITYVEKMGEIEYKDESMEDESLRKMFKYLHAIVKKMPANESKNKKGFLEHVKSLLGIKKQSS